MQSERRRRQMEKIENMEKKQLRILFGICMLFVMCHTCRIVRNFEDLYLRLTMGSDILAETPCSKGCVSPMTLLSHVSIYYKNLKIVRNNYIKGIITRFDKHWR